jgi:hypothetical protein
MWKSVKFDNYVELTNFMNEKNLHPENVSINSFKNLMYDRYVLEIFLVYYETNEQ